MRARLGVWAVLLALSCSDRPVPEHFFGDGQSGEPCAVDEDCVEGSVCFGDVCVREGQFRVSLSWDRVTDFDLHVETPSGAEISFDNPSAGNGYLDLDDCIGGMCTGDGLHVENIFFNDNAQSGTYRVWVVNFDGINASDYTVEVAGAVEQVWTGSLPATDGAIGPVYAFEYGG
jgi:hypothetical protein